MVIHSGVHWRVTLTRLAATAENLLAKVEQTEKDYDYRDGCHSECDNRTNAPWREFTVALHVTTDVTLSEE